MSKTEIFVISIILASWGAGIAFTIAMCWLALKHMGVL